MAQRADATTLAIVLGKNLRLAGMPGNVFLPKSYTGLPKDSVANVTACSPWIRQIVGRFRE